MLPRARNSSTISARTVESTCGRLICNEDLVLVQLQRQSSPADTFHRCLRILPLVRVAQLYFFQPSHGSSRTPSIQTGMRQTYRFINLLTYGFKRIERGSWMLENSQTKSPNNRSSSLNSLPTISYPSRKHLPPAGRH